ncbi:hypothetical protein SLEP1_g8724 [Rubroshorea leprosula]|uniref:Uncharacterized protein n=1 Tax=Rubroshorea leprosula TaxID=152421 RepID=A0AAV5ICG8_9ROSI|nr:hypothetical protein SLEP1_g8724 [Rubroshorea leprosula]
MKNGAKRFSASDAAPAAKDSAFRNKRLMVGSPFDAQRAEPSQPQLPTTTPLDPQRAELSRQHVRALNHQFASWVQLQLKNYPDELWEDGVRDYLAHASNIMEKFSDVVNWLKTNAVKEGSSTAAAAAAHHSIQNKLAPEVKNNEIKLFAGNSGNMGFTAFGSASTFSSSSLNMSFVPTPFASGNMGGTTTVFNSGSTNGNAGGTTTVFTSGSTNMSLNTKGTTTTTSFSGAGMTSSFSPASTTIGFATSWGTGAFSSSTSVSFGNQGLVSANNNASADPDDAFLCLLLCFKNVLIEIDQLTDFSVCLWNLHIGYTWGSSLFPSSIRIERKKMGLLLLVVLLLDMI